MFGHIMLAITLMLTSYSTWATTLYACTINGHTTLESIQSENCDELKVYHFQSSDSSATTATPGLRAAELKQLHRLNQQRQVPVATRRYENVDERLGLTAVHQYQDGMQDKCSYFRSTFNQAQAYIDTQTDQGIHIGPIDAASLAVQKDYAQSQMGYYCP